MKFKGLRIQKPRARVMPDHDYLKYWRVIRFWVKTTYNIGTPDLDMLLFLYSEQIFNKSKFEEYNQLMSWDEKRFRMLLRDGWIHVWRKKQGKETTLYELTYKAKRMINNVYKKLNGEEIPESTNPLFKHDASYMQKVFKKYIKKLNKSIKQQRHLSQQ